MLWLGLHFPQFGLEVFAESSFHLNTHSSSHPSTQKKPSPDLGLESVPRVLVEDNRVILSNAAAAEAGIAINSTLATAHSILPTLRHCNRDAGKETRRLRFLAETLYRFTSMVSLQPPNGLLLEVSGSLKLFGGIERLAEQVNTLCGSLGHETDHRTAETPLAAWLLARSGQSRLHQVPLWATDLEPAVVERFANMGIHTLGPLISTKGGTKDTPGLPEKALGKRFGPQLLNYLQRLTGRLADPRNGISPSPAFNSALHLLDAISNKDALLFPMQRLALELHHWLVGRQLGAEQILWHFSAQGSRAITLPVSFAKAQQSKGALINISKLKLEQAELPADVLTLRLEARRLVPWHTRSQALVLPFPGASPGGQPTSVAIDDLVDQLNARLGMEACHSIRVTDQHCPEQAWRKVEPFAKNGFVGKRVACRPLWLFDPPWELAREEFTVLSGPERIQTGWWQKAISRDYYVARHNNGAECWTFVDAQDRWFLHGYFA